MEYTHKCIKCETIYKDNEFDDYFCSQCLEEKKRIAKEIDTKLKDRPKKPVVSDLQKYDQVLKTKGRVYINDL